MTRRVWVPVLAVCGVLVLGLVVAGAVIGGRHGGGGSSGTAAGSSAWNAGDSAGADGGAAASAPSAAPGNGSTSDLGKAGDVAPRDVVRTAQLAVTAHDPSSAADRATAITAAAGGRVDADNRDTSAHLVLRVPAARLEPTLAQLAALGKETSRQVQGDDVTAQTADLGARVQALQTSVSRLQTLIANSGSLSDLLSVETQLSQRQAELESLQAQQRALADQVALATITVDLVAPDVAATKAGSGPTGFGGAVAGGWHGFTVALRYLLAGLGYALPFLVLVAAAVAVPVFVVRRRRARVTHSEA